MCDSGTIVWSAWDINWPACVHSYNRVCVCKACVCIDVHMHKGRRESGGGGRRARA